jgi:hypothetical protein
MTPISSTMTLDDFLAAIAPLDTQYHLSTPTYARRKVLATAGDTCPLCLKPYDRTNPRGFTHPVIATLVHTFLGGPLTVDNLFVCCRRCQQVRASSDLLTLDHLPDHLATQRLAALQLSTNHLLPLPPSTTLPAFRSALAARHAFPRSRVYAAQTDDGQCFIGVTARYGDGQSKGLARLLAQLSGVPLQRDKRATVFLLTDDKFRQVVWQLIDANALVVCVGRRSDLRDFQDYWWLTSASAGELRLRKVAGLQVPTGVSTRQVGPRALRQRKLVARRRADAQRLADVAELKIAELEFDQAFVRLRAQQAMGLPGELEETRYFVNRYWAVFSRVYGRPSPEARPSPRPVVE